MKDIKLENVFLKKQKSNFSVFCIAAFSLNFILIILL